MTVKREEHEEDMDVGESGERDSKWESPPTPHFPPSPPDSSTQSSPSSDTPLKPTCAVQPYTEKGNEVTPGFSGLQNIGNTCFMNSTLQVLLNTKELRQYFLEKYYYLDINETNPLGMNGDLAVAFGEFLSEMWSGNHSYYNPAKIKALVSKKSAQFTGFAQHDAQEFLSFLLDGLHEDLNRVRDKPLTEAVEGGDRPDKEVADETWRLHLLRNDSVIVDLFHGQYKSRLDCPKCKKVSITFDPFLYLPVPFPKVQLFLPVYFWPVDHYSPPLRFRLDISEDSLMKEVFAKLSEKVHVPVKNMRALESFQNKIYTEYEPEACISKIRPSSDIIFIFQVQDEAEAGEEVVELRVFQRLSSGSGSRSRYVTSTNKCAYCSEERETSLKSCTRCYSAYYCNAECQTNHWPTHGKVCKFPQHPELVGHPFLLSFPKSQATLGRIKDAMEARSKFTIDLFMTPVNMKRIERNLSEVNVEGEEGGNADAKEEPKEDEASSSQTQDENTESTSYSSSVSGSGKRVKLVLGAQRNRERRYRLYKIRGCDKDAGTEYSINNGQGISKKSNEVVDLSGIRYVSMDWENKLGSEDFLIIETKREVEHKEMSGGSGSEAAEEEELGVETLLHKFTETEKLSAEEAWYCGTCKAHVEAEKNLVLWRLPPLIILQMKRFIYSSGHIWRNKDDRHVKYPVSGLDFSDHLCVNAPEQETKYDLYGVVSHSGSSFFGHYVARGRLMDYDGKTEIGWRIFDDSRVTAMSSEQQAVHEGAYLLFYRQRNGPTASTLLSQYQNRTEEIVEKEKEREESRGEDMEGGDDGIQNRPYV